MLDTARQAGECTAPYHWSFGVLYIPYASGRIYPSSASSYYVDYESRMDAQVAFMIYPKVRLTCDLGYARAYSRQKQEEHYLAIDGSYQNDNGYLSIDDLKLFEISVGCKYYFSGLRMHRVSPYLLAGAGKQFAFVTDKSEELFVPQPPLARIDDNREEYLQDLNSPVHVFLGFRGGILF